MQLVQFDVINQAQTTG